MVDRAPARKPPYNLGFRLFTSLHVLLQPRGLETTNNERVRIVPEPDTTGRLSLPNQPGYRLLHSQVHERIIPILDIDQPPGFRQLDLRGREYCFHKIIRGNPKPLGAGPAEKPVNQKTQLPFP